MAGRASIVGAAVTHVGKVREHNEDAHFFDGDNNLFLVCDGMGGHAAGEVASAIAIRTLRQKWSDNTTHGAIDAYVADGSPEARRALLTTLRDGVIAAHDAIIAEAARDEAKTGMGTTLVAAIIVGGDVVFAHAGDSRAYLVRDNIAMQLTEDHTLLSRLLAAGIDVDLSGEGSRFKSMLTNALGIGQDCKVSTFIVPLADGDRFLLCSDGISEYIAEGEVGEVLSKAASPSRAAQKLVDLALERGGGDNATALVVRVLEAGESPLPVERRKKDDEVIAACQLWGLRVTPQQRLRALRIAIPRDHADGEKVPAQTLGDRVAWIIVEGEVEQDGKLLGPTALLYPEALITSATLPDKDGLAVTRGDVRALAIRADDFRELCEEDAELGEAMLDSLVKLMQRRPVRQTARISVQRTVARAPTDPGSESEEHTAILAPPQRVPDGEPLLPPIASRDEDDDGPPSSRTQTRPDSQYGRAKTNPPVRGDVPSRMSDEEAGRASTAQHAIVEPPPETIPPPIAQAHASSSDADGGEALRALWGTGEPKQTDDDVPTLISVPRTATPLPLPADAPGVDATQRMRPVRQQARAGMIVIPDEIREPTAETLPSRPMPESDLISIGPIAEVVPEFEVEFEVEEPIVPATPPPAKKPTSAVDATQPMMLPLRSPAVDATQPMAPISTTTADTQPLRPLKADTPTAQMPRLKDAPLPPPAEAKAANRISAPSLPRTLTPRPAPGQPIAIAPRTITPIGGVESLGGKSPPGEKSFPKPPPLPKLPPLLPKLPRAPTAPPAPLITPAATTVPAPETDEKPADVARQKRLTDGWDED